ncbi:hypothetical protein F4678DRAFT_440552 [Xylaria arbuscula]|nr:hypothetical protein F4678DRAFT_440552 [Xylaria arbuscula]
MAAKKGVQKISTEQSFSTTPNISRAKEILPNHLFRALEISFCPKQDEFVAHIGMSFENNDSCLLTLGIQSGSLKRLMETWFGIHVEMENKTRLMRLLGGIGIQPRPTATIKGFEFEAIEPCFGQQLGYGIQTSPLYKWDKMMVMRYTKAVGIKVSGDICEGASLVLELGLAPAVRIWKALSPEKPRPTPPPSSDNTHQSDTLPLSEVATLALHELERNVSSDHNALPTPVWIVGKNQQISWRDCFVRVYTDKNQQLAEVSYEKCSRQYYTVPEGKEMFFGGDGGYVVMSRGVVDGIGVSRPPKQVRFADEPR